MTKVFYGFGALQMVFCALALADGAEMHAMHFMLLGFVAITWGSISDLRAMLRKEGK